LAQEVLLGNYHGDRCLGGGFACIQTPLAAIQKIAKKVRAYIISLLNQYKFDIGEIV
jgi:hypothetical protein